VAASFFLQASFNFMNVHVTRYGQPLATCSSSVIAKE
jgi:hypothetical protein